MSFEVNPEKDIWGRKLTRYRVFAFFFVGSAFSQGIGGYADGDGRLGLLAEGLLARLAIGALRRLLGLMLGLLRLLGHHDAEIMLRMLKIILGHHPVAARIGVARQLLFFLFVLVGGVVFLVFWFCG